MRPISDQRCEGARGQEGRAGPRLPRQSALRPPRGGESRQRGPHGILGSMGRRRAGEGGHPARFPRPGCRGRARGARQEPLQPLHLLLAVGVVEGVRAGRGGGWRSGELHHRVELARRRCVRGGCASTCGGCATRVRILDLGGEGRGDAPERERVRHPDAGGGGGRMANEGGEPGEARPTCAMPASKARVRRSSPPSTPSGDLRVVAWRECPDGWQAPFPSGGARGKYFAWPLLTDLMPWQQFGGAVQTDVAPLHRTPRRWSGAGGRCSRLRISAGLAKAFKETRDRKIDSRVSSLFESDETAKPVAELSGDAPAPHTERYAYRSFDRQWILADTRLGDYLRPDLWCVQGERQVYLTSLFKPSSRGRTRP